MALTLPQDQPGDVERINEETGELSASGELAASGTPRTEKEGGAGGRHSLLPQKQQLADLLREMKASPGVDPRSPEHEAAQQREQRLLRVLPLYIKVCEAGCRAEGPDLGGFAALTAEMVVLSIHSRLADRPAEEARSEVVEFFRRSPGAAGCEKDNSGWLLLRTLSLFAADDSDLCCINPDLPAALVKCLYLLVCLPARKDSTAKEETFLELLTQVLLQLSRQPVYVEKMVETQELQCLIIGLTSLWDQTSAPWRHQASRVLRALSAAQTCNIIPSLLDKNSVRICIQNLLQISADVPGPVLAEVAVAVFSFITDTYSLNTALFIEFDTHSGYMALEGILKRCDAGVPADQFAPVCDLLDLVASLTLCGKAELKVTLCVSNPQPPGFQFDPSLAQGSAVRNLPAFRLLQNSLLRSEDSTLCCQILRAVQTIWGWDQSNFFLLEWTIQSLAQFATCVWRKPPPVHKQFFSLLEMVVFQLNYIPHETLRAVQGVLKQSWTGALAGAVTDVEFGVAALSCFNGMAVRSGLLADVLSEGGLLELLLWELRKRAKILRKAGDASASPAVCSVPRPPGNREPSCVEESERALTCCMLEVVSALTLRSIRNTVSVRDLGMVPYIKIFLDAERYRGPTLSILEQLAEINPEEFMSTAIGALCSSTQHELGLKHDLLQSILKVLESPCSWDAFRRAGGFTGLLSLVVDMEGALSDPPQGAGWGTLGHQRVLDLLLLTLHILALAVHLHPVNAHYFQTGGFYEKLAEALLQLGCFQMEGHTPGSWDATEGYTPRTGEDKLSRERSFHQFVELAEAAQSDPSLPPTLRTCVRLLSYLDQFATGTCSALEINMGAKAGAETLKGVTGAGPVYRTSDPPIRLPVEPQGPEDGQARQRNAAFSISTVCSESQFRFTCDHTILNPGAVRVIMTLLASVYTPADPQLSTEVQYSVAYHIQAMVKSELNRQIMCEGGLVSTLLTQCRSILLAVAHPLNLPVTRILEKLSSQAITPADFRKFLCLSEPLMCSADKIAAKGNHLLHISNDCSAETDLSEVPSAKTLKRSFSLLASPASCQSCVGFPVPLHQIISLVSMTSPRSFRPQRFSCSPAFVEFDMSESGHGCLFLPSLATVKGVNADSITTGGIGGDCRGFPPMAGLSYSCWFQINRFSLACDSHPIRLLSIVRHMSRAEQQYICLSISFSAYDGCLVISTEEEAFTFLDMMEPEVSTPISLPASLRFRCSSFLTPGQWHHLAVVMAKDVKKTCLVSAYLNGKSVGSGKMRYIQPFPGQYGSMDPTAVIDVCALIGTPSIWKEHAALVWRVGPTYLFEEVLSADAVGLIYAQGTAYLGNYLALQGTAEADAKPLTPRLVPEERILFGINPAVATVTTVAEIRDDYNEVDSRLIAKEMGITSRDQSTPVFLVRNISQHLSGTARTIGAALVGHFGVRTFSPSSAANGFLYLGGPAAILSLVAMAPDDGSLYAAVKVLLSVLETNAVMQTEMIRINGYELFAFLLRMKHSLVSSRTFQLVLYLCRSVDLGSAPDWLHNTPAFQALLCNLEIWQNTSDNLDLSVLNHLDEILKSSSGDGRNAEAMHSAGLLHKLLFQLCGPNVASQKVKIISGIITNLLSAHFTAVDVSRLGLFLVYTLPPLSDVAESCDDVFGNGLLEDATANKSGTASPVRIRNQLLLCFCELLTSNSHLNMEQQNALFKTLGSDWFLLFLQPHLHTSTLQLGLILLTHLLSSPAQQSGFREGVLPGTVVEGTNEPFALMDNLRALSCSYECLSAMCPGFDVLRFLLVTQPHLPQVYGALATVLLGKKASHTAEAQGSLDDLLQSVTDGKGDSPVNQLIPEAACILLELVKAIITQPIHSVERSPGADASWELQFPGSVMQFLCVLHNQHPRDPLWASAEFLHTLAGVVYPLDSTEDGVEAEDNGQTSEDVAADSSHPTRKQVCDFIRILLMDCILNVPANRSETHPVLLLLEFSPDGASVEQRRRFHTELLEFLMDIIHMISHGKETNTHLNSQEPERQSAEGKTAILMENIVIFGKILVEKLYSGMFSGDPESLVTFFADQIVVVQEKGQAHKEKTTTVLYSCTNKVLLYFLSQPRRSPTEQEVVIRTLQVFISRWDVAMATYNAKVTFVTCLLHCLALIHSGSYPEGFGCEVQKRHKRRHKALAQVYPSKFKRSASPKHRTESTPAEAELVSLVEACWFKVMTERQHFLEYAYKIEISANPMAPTGPVSMTDISPLWEETAHKAWHMYTESQKKKLASSSNKKPGLISSAVRSALGRPGKDSTSVQKFLSSMEAQRQRGHSMFEGMRMNHAQLNISDWERVSSRWLRVEEELLRERAVFGPGPGVVLPRGWVQDATEGPNHTRPRIRRRVQRCSKRVPGSTEQSEERGGTEATNETRILCEAGTEAKEDEEKHGQDCDRLTFFPALHEAPAVAEDGVEHCAARPCSHTNSCPDIHAILQELEPGEKVKDRRCVVVVSGLRVTEGVLLFGKAALYLCEGFTLSPTGDVCCRKHHPSSVKDSFISSMLNKEWLPARCRHWPYEDIKEARLMRYLLEDNALELLIRDGHSAFLVFLNKDHISAYKRFCSVVPSLKGKGIAEVIANARRTPVVEKTSQLKWQRGEMSNFEYLMHLNTLAGRTYNDLMQYPVFPWVLADYQSETLDLSDPATFRDLSKPMGAQTERRRTMFTQRYEEVYNSGDEDGLSARCHYCTHYSSAIIVASFLVRMEPFSHTFQALQGGFDIPERMFHSVKKEWESASRDNMGDVRELFPEFYYLPDFLLNSNHIQLGCMEDGTALGDVVLPPWAKDDPHEFIRIHREALESDYVSSHLHLWIDLIFGYRQQGPAAVESINTFHPYFYAQKQRRGQDGPSDPLVKSTILGYVSNFGQVPKQVKRETYWKCAWRLWMYERVLSPTDMISICLLQLFTKSHPPRGGSKKEGSSPSHPVPFFFRLDKVKTSAQPFKELPRGPVGLIVCLEKEVVVLEKNCLLLSPNWSCFFSWGFPDNSCAFGNYATEKIFAVCESLCQWGETLCAACPNQTTLVTAGTSTVVCVWDVAVHKDKLTHMKLRQPLYGHTGVVTCLAVSQVYNVIVSGSRDFTCILWDLEELSYVTQLTGHKASVTALAINELTGEIASSTGTLLYLWTMKGLLLACVNTSCGPQGDILCVGFTQKQEWDARNVIVTGCSDGILRIWRTEYTRTQLAGPEGGQGPAKRWERHLVLSRELCRGQAASQRRNRTNPAITALAMSRTHATLLAGDAWGRVFTWICE